ncbi:phosphoglucomutase/phosphomannomutase family protein [Geomonas sp. Red32]|uniref:phosphoglucomutase/phosphomannomutase family protein n=1 Tax=Geomonas sp. Red32 TaxID=2912856 RepID=UPI00202CD6ED|nr:phosphoglucomutase/phosphomannomutase family protein [Geomonas sp. Red32]MCM0083666.1 phosphoglucomutase/phosphomannomutase family protein [Geomonas sp. Red32]
MQRITFGTSGWRGIMCEDFIFENVKVVTQAIADNVKESGEAGKGIIVGYDSRFMGESFAREAVSVLAGAGIKSFLCVRDTPTPVISFEILRRHTAGAINFTASHNPPEYNGIKWSPSSGGPALPETTRDIERRANEMAGEICYQEISIEEAKRRGLLEEIDPMQAYLEDISKKVDFREIAKLGTLAVNPLYGTGRGYLAEPLKAHGVQVVQMNAHRDPYFGGFPPEPSEKYIQDFIRLVQQDPEIHLGISTDGDADRFGIVDRDGSFIEPNYIIALLLDYLVRVKGMTGGVGRSVATSHLIDAVAKMHGIPVYETPVGFKYIGELIGQDKIIIGGEESAGLTIKGHVPEKDGILACLLTAEMVAHEGAPVKELLERLYSKVGRYLTKRVNLELSPELESAFPERIAATPDSFAGVKVKERITVDGNKFILEDGSWLLFRKSGTEPVVRLYCEASNEDRLQSLVKAGREFILG